MTAPTIGSLCSGYGGLDLAVEQFFGAETVWFSEFEEAPSRVLEAHWPGVPNHGDMTRIDWAAVQPVDILCGGTPCQDLSAAGRRKGMTEGTRSNLWVQMREAIAVIRPKVVVWENVRGAYSACADSEVGQCPGCVDKSKQHRPFLRALGRVLGDLSDLGFDAEVVPVRASDVGAPHGRFRVFVVAVRLDADPDGIGRREGRSESAGRVGRPAAVVGGAHATDTSSIGHGHGGPASFGGIPAAAVAGGVRAVADADGDGRESVGRVVTVGRDADGRRGADRARQPGEPSASAADADDIRHERSGCARGRRAGSPIDGCTAGHADVERRSRPAVDWGPYRPAIERWERVLGRVAPAPTNPDGKGGAHRLSPIFVEFMMGCSEGWVTDVPGITRNQMLKMLGNGVVTQQALLAIGIAWGRLADVREAAAA